MKFLIAVDRLLTPRRLNYAWIAGGVLWAAWLLSTILGTGSFDLAGQVIGTDYLQFYTTGVALRQGQSAILYNYSDNFASFFQMEQSIAGPALTSLHAFLTPPFLAWLFVPLSYVPYVWSFILWSLLSLAFLWLSIRLLYASRPLKTFLLSLTWFPIFATISFGQNSLLSLLIFSITYWLLKKDKYFLAGLVSSLLLFKPQMALGLSLLWLFEWRKGWKSLLGLISGGAVLAGLSFWLLPDASLAYISLARNFLPGMIYQDQFPLIHMHSLRGFFALLFTKNRILTEGLSTILSIGGVIAFFFFYRRHRRDFRLIFAGAICLTLWITPHAMIYDWSILIIPAILFIQAMPDLQPSWKATYALVWIATFISGPLTLGQLKILPVAIQVSVPILFFVFLTIYQRLKLSVSVNEKLEMA